jgi:putative aminopeptidase FrvX
LIRATCSLAARSSSVTDSGDLQGRHEPRRAPCAHLERPRTARRCPEVKEFFVDVGMPADKVKKKFKIGDYVVMDEPADRDG